MCAPEEHLVDCYDILPVTVGLAMGGEDGSKTHKFAHMGYLDMRRDDEIMHKQPFLVNF